MPVPGGGSGMAERTDELTRNGDAEEVAVDDAGLDSDDFGLDGDDVGVDAGELDAEFDAGERTATAAETATGTDAPRVGRVKRRAGDVFSPAAFVLQLGATLVGAFVVGNLVPLLPFAFAAFLGILLTAGVTGTLSAKPRYAEAAVAGGASGAFALFFGAMGLSVVTGGAVPVVGAAAGALAALVGFYAGRDLRDGVTREL